MTDLNKHLAKDVATELTRRGRRRKLGLLGVLALVIAAAVSFLKCGKGWGLGGGGGAGTGTGSGSALITHGPAEKRCTVRVSAKGITVDGTERRRDEAVAECKKTEGALVTVTGDARQGDWDELRTALEAVGVKIYMRGQPTD
ncbi:hypothetical protein BH11MYX1_BH11MYX1_42960 [soil metagenome]